jgi:hypothetical protein
MQWSERLVWEEGLGNRLSRSVRLKDGAERELVMLRSYHILYSVTLLMAQIQDKYLELVTFQHRRRVEYNT